MSLYSLLSCPCSWHYIPLNTLIIIIIIILLLKLFHRLTPAVSAILPLNSQVSCFSSGYRHVLLVGVTF